MRKSVFRSPARKRTTCCALLLSACALLLSSPSARAGVAATARGGAKPSTARPSTTRAAQTTMEWMVLHLRSFAKGASGSLSIEPTTAGGRLRLTVLRLPHARNIAATAKTYVVWAVSEGRFARVGELQTDERGNGGLQFERPASFDHYTVIVTAEPTANADRPAGAPVLSTRAGEALAVFPPPSKNADTTAAAANETAAPVPSATPHGTTATTVTTTTTATPANASTAATASSRTRPRAAKETKPAKRASRPETETSAATPENRSATPEHKPAKLENRPAKPEPYTRPYPSRPGDFYTEVDDALDANGGGRVVELVGAAATANAKGNARATARTGNAYVRVRFRGVPLPSAVGADTYVLWGTQRDGRIQYMGSLPATSDLNDALIYVRTSGFGEDDYNLFVTAERQRPVPRPSDQRALTPRQIKYIVK